MTAEASIFTPSHPAQDEARPTSPHSARLNDLVTTHLTLVYSSALRQLRDPHLASDVTQAVFLILQQKLPRLQNDTHLSLWLLRVTRYACLDAAKRARRREFHEKRAAMLRTEAAPPVAISEISPLLDEALNRLSTADRLALITTYFENQPQKILADRLGLSQAAAHKRVQRALIRLRRALAKSGITAPALTLNAALLAAGQPVPAAVSHAVTTCLAGHAPQAVLTLAKGTSTMLTLLKAKTVALFAAATVALGVAVTLAAPQTRSPARSTTPTPPTTAATPTPADDSFEPVKTLTLNGTRYGQDFAVDLDSAAEVPMEGRGPSVVGMFDWLQDNGADLWIIPRREAIVLMGIDLLSVPTSHNTFQNDQPRSFMMEMLMSTMLTRGATIDAPAGAAIRFRTASGAMGLMSIKSGDGPGQATLQIRMLRPAVRERAAAATLNQHVAPELESIASTLDGVVEELRQKQAQALLRRTKIMEELMKGTSLSAKTHDLATAAQTYEEALRQRNPQKAQSLLPALQREIPALLTTLKQAASN